MIKRFVKLCSKINFLRINCALVMMGILVSMFFSINAVAASCQGGSITVCGVPISLPLDTISIGNALTVHIPPSALGGSYSANPNLTFTAECVGDNNGGVVYQPQGLENISCALFPCQASSVSLCNTSVPVPGGTPIGGVVHLSMPGPFSQDGFTVQCAGNGSSGLPAYEVIDRSAVSCNLKESSQ